MPRSQPVLVRSSRGACGRQQTLGLPVHDASVPALLQGLSVQLVESLRAQTQLSDHLGQTVHVSAVPGAGNLTTCTGNTARAFVPPEI